MNNKNYQLYTDGAYQPDVSICGIGGYLLDDQGNTVFEFTQPIKDAAFFKYHESVSLIYGLKKALQYGVEHITCFSDDISFRNILNGEILSDISSNTNPFRKEIFELKTQFATIHFDHLPRNLNKRADKLAGKILRIYKEDTLPSRTRHDFVDQQEKMLYLPNLVCEEDFDHDNFLSAPTINVQQFENMQKALQYYILVDIKKLEHTLDNIDDNNAVDITLYLFKRDCNNKMVHVEKIGYESIIQKKLTSRTLEMLASAFEYTHQELGREDIGLMFNAGVKPLQKVDMLLRKRGILPIPDTPLTKRIIHAADQLESIVLHNNPELIDACLQHYHHKQKLKM